MKLTKSVLRETRLVRDVKIPSDAVEPWEKFEKGSERFVKSLISPRSRRFISNMLFILTKPRDLRLKSIGKTMYNALTSMVINAQNSVSEEVKLRLGPDVYAIKKTFELNGRIRLVSNPKWYASEIPDFFQKNIHTIKLEAVDLSYSNINDRGLRIYADCHHLKSFTFRSCEFVDDWFLSKFVYLFNDRVHYLDISGCKEIGHNAFLPLLRLKNLKRLKIANLEKLKGHEYAVLLLEDSLKNCLVEGFSYKKGDDDFNKQLDATVSESKAILSNMQKEYPELYTEFINSRLLLSDGFEKSEVKI